MTVDDDDTGTVTKTDDVTVTNVTPNLLLDDVLNILENGTAVLKGTITDIGRLDSHDVTIDWDDVNDTANSTFELDPIFSINTATGDLTQELLEGETFTSTNANDPGTVLTVNTVDTVNGVITFTVRHQYLDDGLAAGQPAGSNGSAFDTSTISVTVDDDDTGTVTKTDDVTVTNVTPNLVLDDVLNILENGTAVLKGTITDIGRLDSHDVTIDWDDVNDTANSTFELDPIFSINTATGALTQELLEGETFTSTNANDPGTVLTVNTVDTVNGVITFTVRHQYLDDGLAAGQPAGSNGSAFDTSTISVTVDDDDTGTVTKTDDVTVTNVTPNLLLDDVLNILENGTAVLKGTITDIGRLDSHDVTMDWDDVNDTANSTFELDPILSINTATGALTQELLEGETFASTNANDPGTVLTVNTVDTVNGVITFTVRHQYLDDGLVAGQPAGSNGSAFDTSTISVTVDDDDTGTVTKTDDVTVTNVTPNLLLDDVLNILENGTAVLKGTIADIGRLDSHDVTIDWDDVNDTANSTFELDPIFSINTANGALTQELLEGETFTSTNANDPGTVLTVNTVDTVNGVITFTVRHQYLDDGISDKTWPAANGTASDTSTIVVTVADDDAGTVTQTDDVTVTNVSGPGFG